MKVCQGVLKALTTLSENSQPTTQPNRTAASLLEFGKIDRGGEDMSRYGRSCQGILKCLTTLSDRLSMAPESRHLSSGFTAFSEYRHMRMDSGKCGGYPGVPHSTDRKMEGRVWKEGVKKGGKEKGKSLVGTVCPRGTTGAKMLPSMATPRERGTTSRRRRSAVSAEVAFPERIPAWTAAP
jgi:hypothetical protein